jgi:hypothetical protein
MPAFIAVGVTYHGGGPAEEVQETPDLETLVNILLLSVPVVMIHYRCVTVFLLDSF